MIDTVLFDMGGTLEDIVSTPETLARAALGITKILESHDLKVLQTPQEMGKMLSEGLKHYGEIREQNFIELKPDRIWTDYMLCESGIDKEKIEAISEELANAWEILFFERKPRPGVKEMLEGLRSLGLKLGIVSNTASLYQVFEQLEKYGFREYFSDVTLSSQVGYRKPHPNIFRIALLQMRSDAQHCVYVGDTVSRDVLGSKQAGLTYSILIHSKLTKEKDETLSDAPKPDYIVGDITEVLEICQDLIKENTAV